MKVVTILFWLYLCCLHLLLVLIVVCAVRRGDGVSALLRTSNGKHIYYQRQMEAFCQRVDDMASKDSVICVGDSVLQGLDVRGIDSMAVNHGIGGDTTSGVMARLQGYRSLDSAKALVLAVGYNDLRSSTNPEILSRYGEILASLPPGLLTICCAVFPTDETVRPERFNGRITELNQGIAGMASRRPVTKFLDLGPVLADGEGNLSKEYHVGDGLHLNLAGRRLLVRELGKCLGRE